MKMHIPAAPTKVNIQMKNIFRSFSKFTQVFSANPTPTTEPTRTCELDKGNPSQVPPNSIKVAHSWAKRPR
jgi:hypothetical protein